MPPGDARGGVHVALARVPATSCSSSSIEGSRAQAFRKKAQAGEVPCADTKCFGGRVGCGCVLRGRVDRVG